MRPGDTVSVPLRGYFFEIAQHQPVQGLCRQVSVPLRGYFFEIIYNPRSIGIFTRFRPLTGIFF